MNKHLMIFTAICILATGFGAFMAGFTLSRQDINKDIFGPSTPVTAINTTQAMKIINRMRASHQYYIDRPKEMLIRANALNKTTDYMFEFHIGRVREYDAIFNYMIKNGKK